MSAIKSATNTPGTVASFAATNTVYSNIVAGTAALDSTNTQTEWVSQSHISDDGFESFNSDFEQYCNATGTFVMGSPASETYVVIDLSGDPMRISHTYNWIEAGERLRVHADINVDDIGFTFPAGALMSGEEDMFYLQLWYRESTGAYFPFSQEWGWSPTSYPTNVIMGTVFAGNVTTLKLRCNERERNRFKCSVTGFLTAIAGGIDRVELRARVVDDARLTVNFRYGAMTAFMVRS